MVVLARPRAAGGGGVALEEDDVIEYVLQKPYGEVLGCTLDSSTLQRSPSARARRRERVRDGSPLRSPFNSLTFYKPVTPARPRHQERSPDQFGAMFRTLPAMSPGYLHPPAPIPVHATLPRRSELSHGNLSNGQERHGSPGSRLQGTYLPSVLTPTVLATAPDPRPRPVSTSARAGKRTLGQLPGESDGCRQR